MNIIVGLSIIILIVIILSVLKRKRKVYTEKEIYEKKIRPELFYVNTEAAIPGACRILIDRDEIFPEIFALLEKAEKYIYFNMFLFGGEIADNTLELLSRIQQKGVKVIMILQDQKESINIAFPLPDIENEKKKEIEDYEGREQKANDMGFDVSYPSTEIFYDNSIFNIDHGKLIVIDGIYAVTGGMNFASTSEKNHDSSVIFTGEIVKECEKIFLNKWLCSYKYDEKGKKIFNDPENMMELSENSTGVYKGFSPCEITPVITAPYVSNTLDALIYNIEKAEHRIYISQFMVTEKKIIRALIEKARQGLDVKVLLDPGDYIYPDLDLKGGPNNLVIALFQKMKKKHDGFTGEARRFIVEPGQQLHMKLIIIDENICFMGSTNLMSAAILRNYEEYFLIRGQEVNRRYTEVFLKDWSERSEQVRSLELSQKAIALFGDLFV